MSLGKHLDGFASVYVNNKGGEIAEALPVFFLCPGLDGPV